MKKLLFAAALFSVTAAFANNPPDVNQKVLDEFKKTFATSADVTWYENENSYEARFSSDGVRAIVWYNKKGELILTHRHYDANKLPPLIAMKIRDDFPQEKILGVTEITNRSGMYYYLTLENEKNWMKLKADVQGEYEVYEKFKKATP